MNTRHIAFLGFTASSFLAISLAGCSADDTTKKAAPKDGGTTSTGAAGSSTGAAGSTTGAAGDFGVGGDMTGVGGMGGSIPAACTPPALAPGVLAGTMISDLEPPGGVAITSVVPGGGWYSYKDLTPGNMLSPDNAAFMAEAGGANGTTMAVHVVGSGFMPPGSATSYGAGVGMALAADTQPVDLSMYSGISFYAKSGAVPSEITVAVAITGTVPVWCECVAEGCYDSHFFLIGTAMPGMAAAMPLPTAWTKYTVKWTDLHQSTYGHMLPFDPTKIVNINFTSNGPVPTFDYWIDEISVVP
jgi:hypothetical protein